MVRSNYNADHDDDSDYYSSRRQLASTTPSTATAVNITSKYSGFKLPDGWDVEQVPRSDPSKVDKYYYEPGTGLKFRSLRAVERHINGEEFTPTPHALTSPRKMIICGGKMVRLTEETSNESQLAIVPARQTAANSPYNLPDGWFVEERPRRGGSRIDKYYYEPGSGQKFRSFSAAQRHISELDEDITLSAAIAEIKDMNRPLAKAFKLRRVKKNSASFNIKSTRNNTEPSSFVNPPTKVEWVLASPQGDAWKPFVFDRAVPDSIKQQWNERFKLAMNVENPDEPNHITLC